MRQDSQSADFLGSEGPLHYACLLSRSDYYPLVIDALVRMLHTMRQNRNERLQACRVETKRRRESERIRERKREEEVPRQVHTQAIRRVVDSRFQGR